MITFIVMYAVVLTRGRDILRNIALLIMFSFLFIFLLYNTEQKRIFEVFSTEDYNYISDDGRLAIWKYSIKVISENPIFGVGASCFPEAIAKIRESKNLPPKWQPTHNTFLQVASEIGLIGFVLFIMLIYRTYDNLKVKINKNSNITSDNRMVYLSKCIKIGFISSIVCAFFLSHAYSIVFPFYFAVGESISYVNEYVD